MRGQYQKKGTDLRCDIDLRNEIRVSERRQRFTANLRYTRRGSGYKESRILGCGEPRFGRGSQEWKKEAPIFSPNFINKPYTLLCTEYVRKLSKVPEFSTPCSTTQTFEAQTAPQPASLLISINTPKRIRHTRTAYTHELRFNSPRLKKLGIMSVGI